MKHIITLGTNETNSIKIEAKPNSPYTKDLHLTITRTECARRVAEIALGLDDAVALAEFIKTVVAGFRADN